jgi:hypothetical protein
MGFWPGRSTTDNIHIVRQILEERYEYNINLHNLFIDFSQAFDAVNRDKLFEYLEYYQTPPKLIKLLNITLQDTTTKVKINNEMTELIEIKSGVRQGDPLCTLLFNIVIDVIIKKLNPRGNISTRLMQTRAYADDVLVISRTQQTMIDTFTKLKGEASKVGLTINENKTKYRYCTRQVSRNVQFLKKRKIEQVTEFKYLGSIVNNSNSIEDEIKERTAAGNKSYYANKSFFQSKLISKSAKLKFNKAVIRPVVTYASET